MKHVSVALTGWTDGPRMARELNRDFATIVQKTGDRAIRHIKAAMRAPKHGRMYPKTDGTGMYRASARGEAPAVDTGTLIRSIGQRLMNNGTRSSIGTDVLYGKWLEAPKSLDRPFAQPAFDDLRGPFERDVMSAVKRKLNSTVTRVF